MKRIGIDARLYFQTGIGVYLRNLFHYLALLDTYNVEFYIYVLKEDAHKINFITPNFIKRSVGYRWHSLAEQTGFLNVLYRDKLDLMHFTYFSHPVLYSRPFISTVHDIIILEHKTGRASTKSPIFYSIKYLAFKYALSHQIKKSLKIICPTHTVKNQIVQVFGKQYASKIQVIYEGVDFKKIQIKESVTLEKNVPEKFFLYVGNFYPHKNIDTLIRAFTKVHNESNLVLVGPSDFFSKRVQKLVGELHLDKRIFFYFNASDEDLKYLYSHTQALIHPSLSEGVGLPLVEAAYMNVPVIASNIAVYREILGSTYTAFDPYNSDDIAEKINTFLKNSVTPNYSDILKAFSFPRMVQNTLKLYNTLA